MYSATNSNIYCISALDYQGVEGLTDGNKACPICGRKFQSPSAVRVHMRIHTGERPYECNNCRKRFTRKGHLKSHMLVHLNTENV
jgi:uncharacterized Zn-finger protein